MSRSIRRLASLWAGALLLAGLAAEEDSILYPLSIPLELEINGVGHGEILVRSNEALDRVAIEGSSLKEILRDRAAESMLPIIEALPDGHAPLEALLAAGLEISLNLERLVIEISIQEEVARLNQGRRTVRLGPNSHGFERAAVAEARLSGYINARLRADYSDQPEEAGSGSSIDARLSLDHVFNISGWAVEGQSSIQDRSGRGRSAFVLHDLRVVKDFPARALRLAAGDISTPISHFQQGFALFGVSLSREFRTQPYQVFTPTGTASFELDERSQVDIYLNGGLRKSLALDPGEYSLEEFKLLAGANNLDVRIRGASGREQSIDVTRYAAPELLGRGVSDYAVSVGLPPSDRLDEDALRLSMGSIYERSLDTSPIVSAYYARGVGDSFTAEANAQARAGWGRGSLSATWSNGYGAFFFGASANALDGEPVGSSLRLAWRAEALGAQLRAETAYYSDSFALTHPGETRRVSSVEYSSSLGVARRIGERWDASLTGFHQSRHDGKIEYAATTQIGRRFGDAHASLNFKLRRHGDRSESAAYLRFSWSPRPKWIVRSQVGAGGSGAFSGNEAAIYYSERRAKSYIGSSLRAQMSGERSSMYGDVQYQNDYFDVAISRDEIYSTLAGHDVASSRYSLSASSAIAFADGVFGFARRVRDSFAIVDSHPAWRGTRLGINPGLGGYQRASDGRGPRPVLADLHGYRASLAVVHTIDSDMFLENNEYQLRPSYRRGTKLVIGTDEIYTLRGALLDSFGDAYGLRNISLTRADGARVNTFTNKAGRFIVSGLGEGVWTIAIAGSDETAEVLIEGEKTFIFIERIQTR